MGNNANENVKWFGITVDKWFTMIQTIGIPGAFMAFICLGLYQYVPPVVKAHMNLLDRTGQTLESMDETLQQSNKMLNQIMEVEQSTQAFMDQVLQDHRNFQDKLDDIHGTTVK